MTIETNLLRTIKYKIHLEIWICPGFSNLSSTIKIFMGLTMRQIRLYWMTKTTLLNRIKIDAQSAFTYKWHKAQFSGRVVDPLDVLPFHSIIYCENNFTFIAS